jgi:phage terminase large subunit
MKKSKELHLPGVPNPRQIEFFKAIARHIGYGGARGGGKSWALRRKFVLLAFNYSGLKLLLLRRTLPELRENHILPLRAELNGFAKYNDDEKAFYFPNGSRLKLGYCDSEADVLQFQGQEYDVVGFEEATQFTDYQIDFILTCNRSTRTDFKPRAYYTCNPGGVGHARIKRLFIDRQYQGREKAEDYVFIPAKVYDNTVLMETNPEYVETLENLPEALRRAHLEGDWNVFAGQYFSNWRDSIHKIKPIQPDPNHRHVISMDYGLDKAAVYWWDIDQSGTCRAYRELYESELGPSQVMNKIISMTLPDEAIEYIVAPPDLWNRSDKESKLSTVELMQAACNYRFTFIKGDNSRVNGWLALYEYLEPYQNELGETTAKLLVCENCPNLIRTLPQLIRDEHNPNDVSDKNHELTHAPDSTRYFIRTRPGATELKGKSELDQLAERYKDQGGKTSAEYQIMAEMLEDPERKTLDLEDLGL